ncbi:TIR domain-containing protein [Ferrovibrio sp. MS7]|uniref:TIR domain-containing protein n=1 Tax=Ferrovibrio plantarum TaxID=3119164 RepID=UPI00313693C3
MTAFLSHSSKDKAFIRQVAEQLGKTQIEYDEWTFEYKLNVQAIHNALNRCNLFVFFLSQNSIASSYVNEELRAALENRGKGLIKRVLIFALDQTSHKALPGWLQDINIVRKISSPKMCARQIQVALMELEAQEDQGIGLYLGRETDESDLRKAIIAPPESTPIYLHAVGHYGIGRRTFLSKSLSKFFPRLYNTFVEVTLGQFEGPEELYRQLFTLSEVASADETYNAFLSFSKMPAINQAAEIGRVIRNMALHNEFVIVIDNGGALTDDGELQPFLADLLDQLKSAGQPSLGFIQTRMMPFSRRQNLGRTFHQYLKPLSTETIIELVSLTLKEFGISFSEAQVSEIANLIDGHPYNIRFVIQFILNFGIDSLLTDPSDLIDWKNRRAVDFLRKIKFSAIEEDLMAILSEYQYLDSHTLIAALDEDSIVVTQAIKRLQEHCCVELREHYFHISPPIRDGMRRDDRFHRDDSWKQQIGQAICALIDGYEDDDHMPVTIIQSATLAAARAVNPPAFLSTLVLPSHLLRIAKEYYDAGKRGPCMEFCERAYGMKNRLPIDAQVEALRLWGLSAVRLKKRQMIDHILEQLKQYASPIAKRVGFFLEGFEARRRGQLDIAEGKFKEAWKLTPSNESVNRELASLYCRQRRYQDAEVHARAAYKIAPTNPFILDIFADTLLGKLGMGLRVDQKELSHIMDQLKIYGDAPGSSFFLVRDAQQKLKNKNRQEALSSINRAIERTPNLPDAYFIRAEIHLAASDCEAAEADLKALTRILAEAGSSEGEEGAVEELEVRIFMERKRFRDARNHINNAKHISNSLKVRLLDQLARHISATPREADTEMQEWAKNHKTGDMRRH